MNSAEATKFVINGGEAFGNGSVYWNENSINQERINLPDKLLNIARFSSLSDLPSHQRPQSA